RPRVARSRNEENRATSRGACFAIRLRMLPPSLCYLKSGSCRIEGSCTAKLSFRAAQTARNLPKSGSIFKPCEIPRSARDDGDLKRIAQFSAHALTKLRRGKANVPKKFPLS